MILKDYWLLIEEGTQEIFDFDTKAELFAAVQKYEHLEASFGSKNEKDLFAQYIVFKEALKGKTACLEDIKDAIYERCVHM